MRMSSYVAHALAFVCGTHSDRLWTGDSRTGAHIVSRTPVTVTAWLSLLATVLFGAAGWIGWLILQALKAGRYTARIDARMDGIEIDHKALQEQLSVARAKQSELTGDLQRLISKALICEERYDQAGEERVRVRTQIDELQRAIWRNQQNRS